MAMCLLIDDGSVLRFQYFSIEATYEQVKVDKYLAETAVYCQRFSSLCGLF
jgi:hypothetical protein